MRVGDFFRFGLINLSRRKARTILTALSMMIGVMCIIVLISVGIGYEQSYRETVESMGSLTKIDVTPQQDRNRVSALLNDKAVEAFKGMEGVEAATPVVQTSAYLKSSKYVTMVKLYGIDLATAGSFQLTPTAGELPGPGIRLKPEVMLTDDVAASFADPNHDWEDALDDEGNPLVDPLNDSVKLTFDYATLTGEQTAGADGRALPGGTLYNLRTTALCSTLNYTFSTSAFLDRERLEEWITAGTQGQAGRSGQTSGASGQSGRSGQAAGTSGQSGQSGAGTSGQSGSGQTQSGQSSAQSGGGSGTSGQSREQERGGTGSRGGRDDEKTYDLVWVKASSVDQVQRISEVIRDAGFQTYSLNDMLETVRTQSRQIQGMLGAIGLVAMLVSGIGIANTMMMSINERTKEVGVLKVLGSDLKDIALMFLIEAFLVGIIGGLGGLGLSYGMGKVIPKAFEAMEVRSVIPWWLAVSGVAFAGVVALLSAMLPALNAMRISPNAAIRSE